MKKKVFIVIGVILVLAVAALLLVPRFLMSQNQAQSNFQTEPAKFSNITDYVGATGSVRANQTATVSWQTSGRVANVYVEKGQVVEVDAKVADLDPSSLSQTLILAKADLISAQKALDDLMTGSEARANAHLALIQAQQALDDAEEESQSKLYQRASQETIDIAKANLITANEALDSAESTFDQFSGLGEDSPVYAAALSQYAQARQVQQNAEWNLRYVQDLPDPLAVEEVYAKLEQAKATLLTAKQEWERIKDGPDPDDIEAAEARVTAAQATLDTAYIEAPFTGTITDLDVKTGDLISAGSPAFTIHDMTHLLIDLQVSEVDINSIKVGQPVDLIFDAIIGVDYTGTVTDIASVGALEGGAVNFTVTVEVDNPDEAIKPGMTGAANIAINLL